MSQAKASPDLQNLFEETADNYDTRIEVGQGHEGISLAKPLVSRGFAQCSALLLIDKISGAALLKHAGPRSLEVFSGDRGIGEGLQDDCSFFKQQAVGHAVLMVPIKGTISYNREQLASKAQQDLENNGCTVEALTPITVPSTQWKWQIYYDPMQGLLVTQHYDNKDPVCLTHALPGLDLATRSPAAVVAMTESLVARDAQQRLKAQIKKHAGYSNVEELAAELELARSTIGPTALHGILANRLDDWDGQTAAQICAAAFKRQCAGHSRIAPEQAVRCIEALARYDMQNDATRSHYVSTLFNMSYEVEQPALKAYIVETTQGLIGRMQDTAQAKRFSNYLKNEL